MFSTVFFFFFKTNCYIIKCYKVAFGGFLKNKMKEISMNINTLFFVSTEIAMSYQLLKQ